MEKRSHIIQSIRNFKDIENQVNLDINRIFDEIIVANIQKESFTNKINCFLSKNKI